MNFRDTTLASASQCSHALRGIFCDALLHKGTPRLHGCDEDVQTIGAAVDGATRGLNVSAPECRTDFWLIIAEEAAQQYSGGE